MTGNFWGLSQVLFVSTMKQFCENINCFMVIQPKPVTFRYFIASHLFTFYSMALFAKGQADWSESTNFNKIQDGT